MGPSSTQTPALHSDDDFGPLTDPTQFVGTLNVDGHPADRLLAFLDMMLRIRVTEEVIAELVESGTVKCPCHLGIGQEAVAVGVAACLTPRDRAFGTHRSHSHYLAMGGPLPGLLAEVLGRASGCSGGMGGSMHLIAREQGFWGSVPIVAATVPVAVGAALSARLGGVDAVAVAFFGDGACEEGVVHESLNLAASMRLPVLFVVENNLYSSHLDIQIRQPAQSLSRFGVANCIDTRIVDGNDVLAVEAATRELVERARAGGGPGFLEAVTYRWRGHVGPSQDIDVGVRRSMVDVAAWLGRDPVRRLAEGLIGRGDLTPEELTARRDRLREEVTAARDAALEAPWPEPSALLDLVYAAGPVSPFQPQGLEA